MSLVVVAGATGYLGRFLVAGLAERGVRVRALARPGKAVEGAAEVFEGEATRAATLAGLCDGADAVFSSLGITRQKDRVTFEQVDHQANLNVLGEAKRAGVRRFGFVSVVRPELFASSAMVQARERFVADLLSSGLEARLVRATGFFNDLREPFEMAEKGRVYLIGDGTARINPIHGADLARACADALEGGDEILSVGGPDTFTWNEIAALAFDALGRPARVTHVPGWMASSMLPLVRPFSRRAYDIASFVRTVSLHDITGQPCGTHHLGDFYRELAAQAQAA